MPTVVDLKSRLHNMADFCRYCSGSLFGKDFKDLAGLITPEETQNGVVAAVICEGCGFVTVDHEGNCTCHTDEQHERILRFEDPPAIPQDVIEK